MLSNKRLPVYSWQLTAKHKNEYKIDSIKCEIVVIFLNYTIKNGRNVWPTHDKDINLYGNMKFINAMAIQIFRNTKIQTDDKFI